MKTKIKKTKSIIKDDAKRLGLTLGGNHEVFQEFRGKCKLKGYNIGEKLVEILGAWNKENK